MGRWLRALSTKAKTAVMVVSLLTAQAFGAVAPFMPAATVAADPTGNNGTLKIHEQGTPSGTENNDPKVCIFNVEGFGFDQNQSGYVNFDVQGGDGPTGVAAGPYTFGPTDATGYYASQYFQLQPGHYKATLYGKDTGGNINLQDEKAKSKVFKVICSAPTITTRASKSSLTLGQTVNDVASLSGGTGTVSGSVKFYVCGPSDSNPDCSTGGTQVGSSVTVANGQATSSNYQPSQVGHYCFRAEYTPDSNAKYYPASHTNQTTECFEVVAPTGHIIVTKVVNNLHGGTAKVSDFPLYVNNTQVTSGVSNTYASGQSYTVSEAGGPSGYTQTDIECTDGYTGASVNTTFTLGNKQTIVCTITNTDIAPKLTLKKIVVNTHGGKATTANFQGEINGTSVGWGATNTKTAGVAYTLSESVLEGGEGYTASDWSCDGGSLYGDKITLALGDDVTCTITNSDQPASITGTKYEVNADGTRVAVLGGVQICIDTNDNDVCDENEVSTTTDENGNYSFSNLAAGTYKLIEKLQDGWTKLFGGGEITVTNGQTSTENDFGNFEHGSISGYKWNDVNGSGTKQEDEPKLSDWTIQLKQDGEVVATTTTDEDGNYSFDDLAPGTYTVCEVQQDGWVQITPIEDGCYTVTIDESGETNPRKNFGNQKSFVPQVLGETTTSPAPTPNAPVVASAELTNTGLPVIAYALAALTLLGSALFVTNYRREQ